MTQKEILSDRIDTVRRVLSISASPEYLDGMINGYISLARGLGILDLDEYIEECEEQDEFMKELEYARK
jgi:hypothetical protein